jgi:hypothetical protein
MRSKAKSIWIGTLNSFRKYPLRTIRSISNYEPLVEESDILDSTNTERTTQSGTLAKAAKLQFDVPNHLRRRLASQRPKVLSSHFLAPPGAFSALPEHHPKLSPRTSAPADE